jgi:hypothetical protein
MLGLICAVLAWVPYVGSILGGLLVVLVAATDFPADPSMAYWAIGLFVLVRLLDDFVYMPMTIGKSLELHPLITVLMIFAGGAVAGNFWPDAGAAGAGRGDGDRRDHRRHRFRYPPDGAAPPRPVLRRGQASADL